MTLSQTSLRAKPVIWKCVPSTGSFSTNQPRFETEKKAFVFGNEAVLPQFQPLTLSRFLLENFLALSLRLRVETEVAFVRIK